MDSVNTTAKARPTDWRESAEVHCDLSARVYENPPASAALANVKNAHHPNTMANEVPRFTLLTQVNPIAVSTKVQIMKISSDDAKLKRNTLSEGFMKYPGFVATGF